MVMVLQLLYQVHQLQEVVAEVEEIKVHLLDLVVLEAEVLVQSPLRLEQQEQSILEAEVEEMHLTLEIQELVVVV